MSAAAITVGIPFIEAGPDLDRAIRSVYRQTLSDWVLILYGDGVADNALADLARRHHDPRVRVTGSTPRRGLAAALNAITALVQTEWTARMDSDDVMLPERLTRQLEFAATRPEASVIASHMYVIDGSGSFRGKLNEIALPADRAGFLTSNALSHPSVIARSDWMRANPYSLAYPRAEDKELWLRAWGPQTFAKLGDALMLYRMSEQDNWSKTHATCRDDRALLRLYGPDLVGKRNTGMRIARTYWAEMRAFAARMTPQAAQGELDRKLSPVPSDEAQRLQAYVDSLSTAPSAAEMRVVSEPA